MDLLAPKENTRKMFIKTWATAIKATEVEEPSSPSREKTSLDFAGKGIRKLVHLGLLMDEEQQANPVTKEEGVEEVLVEEVELRYTYRIWQILVRHTDRMTIFTFVILEMIISTDVTKEIRRGLAELVTEGVVKEE